MKFKCLSINGFAGDRTPFAMKECHSLSQTIGEHFGIDVEYHGEPFPVADLNWDKALIKSKQILAKAASLLKEAFKEGTRPLIITPRCATAIATLPQVMSKYPDCVVVYFDAHGDLTTPTTSLSGYLGGMPIAAAMGHWDSGYGAGVKAEQFVHVGGRDFDECETDFLNESKILVLPKKQIEEDLSSFECLIKNKPVYIHIDVDSFDPSEVVAEYSVEDGLFRSHVKTVLESVNDKGKLVGLEITEFSPKTKKERDQSCIALLEALQGLTFESPLNEV